MGVCGWGSCVRHWWGGSSPHLQLTDLGLGGGLWPKGLAQALELHQEMGCSV